MIREDTTVSLRQGKPFLGRFKPAGSDNEVPGVLTWSDDDGARLELLGPVEGWPSGLSDESFDIHGYSYAGDDVTIPRALINHRSLLPDEPKSAISATLIVGEHTTAAERWPRASFTTYNLYPWRDAPGFAFSYPNKRVRPDHMRVDWQPQVEKVDVRGARLRFVTAPGITLRMQHPSLGFNTEQRMQVLARRPLTVRHAERNYGHPLAALTSFGVNNPDGMVREVFWNPSEGRRIEVWHSGETRTCRPWRPGTDRMLFEAVDLSDFARALRRWWRLFEKTWPALGIFGDHVREGRVYSPSRFLILYSAVESYSRQRHGHMSLKKLRTFAEVPSDVIGCSNDALALIGSTRDYLAHRVHGSQKFSRDEIQDNAFLSIRRLEGLMQACLLREIGFSGPRATGLLDAYYARWRIPTRALAASSGGTSPTP
jgi:hypothetical protein